MKCPHCGKDVDENIVHRWRKSFVGGCVLEEVTTIPTFAQYKQANNKYYQYHKRRHGGPLLVIVSEEVE